MKGTGSPSQTGSLSAPSYPPRLQKVTVTNIETEPDAAASGFLFINRFIRNTPNTIEGDIMTRKEKELQIRKEAKATIILFVICFLWHVGFAYGLSGTVTATIAGIPLWWWLSTPGVFVVAVIGVVILLKKVFVNFSLDDEEGGVKND